MAAAAALPDFKADGGDQKKFDEGMRAVRKADIQIWPSPDVMEKMGAMDALCKVANMNIGLPDTFAYYDEAEFCKYFKDHEVPVASRQAKPWLLGRGDHQAEGWQLLQGLRRGELRGW